MYDDRLPSLTLDEYDDGKDCVVPAYRQCMICGAQAGSACRRQSQHVTLHYMRRQSQHEGTLQPKKLFFFSTLFTMLRFILKTNLRTHRGSTHKS